jgi:hypothetical protein
MAVTLPYLILIRSPYTTTKWGWYMFSPCCVKDRLVWCPGQKNRHLSFSSMDVVKGDYKIDSSHT